MFLQPVCPSRSPDRPLRSSPPKSMSMSENIKEVTPPFLHHNLEEFCRPIRSIIIKKQFSHVQYKRSTYKKSEPESSSSSDLNACGWPNLNTIAKDSLAVAPRLSAKPVGDSKGLSLHNIQVCIRHNDARIFAIGISCRVVIACGHQHLVGSVFLHGRSVAQNG